MINQSLFSNVLGNLQMNHHWKFFFCVPLPKSKTTQNLFKQILCYIIRLNQSKLSGFPYKLLKFDLYSNNDIYSDVVGFSTGQLFQAWGTQVLIKGNTNFNFIFIYGV